MEKTTNIKLKVNAMQRLLELIEKINKSIENSKNMNSPLMIKQFEHLKKTHTKELLELLEEYQLPL